MMSLEQSYSPFHDNDFHNNDDLIDDINNIEAENVYVKHIIIRGTLTSIIHLMMGVTVIPIFLFMMRMSVNMIFILIIETSDDLFLQWPI